MRKFASTIKDFWSSEGSGGDVRRTSYTLPPESASHLEQFGTIRSLSSLQSFDVAPRFDHAIKQVCCLV
jgi:hypothetical protein